MRQTEGREVVIVEAVRTPIGRGHKEKGYYKDVHPNELLGRCYSEVIERARSEGPQSITRHGRERAVVLSIEDYRSLVAQRPDFKSYLLGGPKVDDFSVERDPSGGREIDL